MAEAALFSIASKLLLTMGSSAFEEAYQRARSIWGVTDELKELKETISSIQSVLLDADRKHIDSATVKNWIGRVRNVLYDAEDLFDFVATHDLIKQRMKPGNKHFKLVCIFFSKLNPMVSRDFISKKVKAIRKELRLISCDMALLGFVRCENERFSTSGIKRGTETGSFVNPEDIIGRDDEKKRVIDFVYDKAYVNRNISLISIVGIGGMGKSALAQLVYNDAKICADFEHRYWACISDIYDEKEVLGKINQSMTSEGKYLDLCLNQLQSSIRESIHRNGRFLLVLDDLWDEDAGRGSELWSILSSDDAKGSKIIITTRHLSVAKAMRADEILDLQGLSRDKSWVLFSRYAFSKDQENDPTWISIGQKIVSKCSDVPLAIKSIASLLRVKDSIGEWRSLEHEQLSRIQLSDNSIMATLRLSYDHLPSHLKNCFAYCSLFPKGHQLDKEHLIYLWIAHGCITPKKEETLDMAGNACFMELFRRSFFQEMKYSCDDEVEVISCKMHDLVHDLAEDVAGEESCIITSQEKYQCHRKIRHLCVDYDTKPKNIDNPLLLLDPDRLRTALYTRFSFCPKDLDEKVTKFRFLRVLSLGCQNIEYVPSSIGGLKYLRYLDLSDNKFTHLPDSITKLVNLIILDVGYCYNLVTFPRDIGKLVSLKHLINSGKLRCMPPSFGNLTSLEHLSNFLVTNSGEFCGLNELGRLNIRGGLMISFHDAVEWSRDQVLFEPGKVPETLEALHINDYPSMKMEAWWKEIDIDSGLRKLERLLIRKSLHVKYLPPLRHLPCLRSLHLFKLCELEFIEVDEVLSTKPFFPSLCTLKIVDMENLKGWSTSTNAILVFPCLSELLIADCPLLSSLPIDAPHLKSLYLCDVKAEFFDQLVSRSCAKSVEKIVIDCCEDMESFSGEGLTSLQSLKLAYCKNLRNVKVAENTVEELTVLRCPNIELWEQRDGHEMSVDWASFAKLCVLNLDEWQQDSIRLPDCLQQLMILGKLRVDYRGY